jgi:hypothetical protein
MRCRPYFLSVFLAWLLLCPSILAAGDDPAGRAKRDNGVRSISGGVHLPSGAPAAGAVVKLKDLKTLAVRSFVASGDGRFHFQNLSSNVDYVVHADLEQMHSSSKTVTVFDSRPNVVVNLKLEAARK